MSQLDSFLFLKAAEYEDEASGNRRTEEVLSSENGFESGVDYIRITILRRNLQRALPWVTQYPAVHFRAFCGDELNFHTFLAPEFLNKAGSEKNTHRVYQSDQTALGPIAYKNGLQLEFGLFGATSSDHLGTALGIFQELSHHSSSAFVSEALPFANILRRSLDMAVGNGEELKLNVGFKGSVNSLPGAGTYAIVFKGNKKIDPARLFMDHSSTLVTDRGAAFRSAPYIAFKVDKLTWRDDWELIPELREPWETVRAAGRSNHFPDFEAAIGVFKRACILSRDLCRDQIDLLRKFADDILFEAKDTYSGGYESADAIRFDNDPGSMSAAFNDMYEAETVGGETDDGFESIASLAPRFVVKGATRIFKRKARDWKTRPRSVSDALTSPKAPVTTHAPAPHSEGPSAFERGLEFVLKWEGGFVDDPDDPGGRTNKGVTQKTYNKWRAKKGLLAEDVLNITEQEVHAIYLQDYWAPVAKNWYPDQLAIALFDSAINMGQRRAVSMLQHAINETRNGQIIAVDGAAGNQTYAALRECIASGAQSKLLEVFIETRRGVYYSIVDGRPRSAKYLNGWMNRLNDLANFVGVSGGGFESFGADIKPHKTKRLEDLGDENPLEKPLAHAPRKPSMISGGFESITSISAEELAADAEDILALDDREERHANALELIFDALDGPWQSREGNVKAVLKKIRQGRDFDLLHVVATEAEREGTARPLARTFRAQALIELGLIDEAIFTLEDALAEQPEQFVQMEIRGLLGRAFKSAYFETVKSGEPNIDALKESIDAYLSTFLDYESDALWHGVNALALLKRSDTDGNPLKQDIDRRELANRIISLGIERIAKEPENETIWDRASVAEAHIALNDWDGVKQHLADYISLTGEKFTLASTLRQFKQVWQLDSPGAPPEARKIMAELHSALAATPGAEFELTADDLDAIEDLTRAEATENPVFEAFKNDDMDGEFERVVDGERVKTFRWAENLANIGRAVARVDSNHHNPKGTAFLINGEELFGEQAAGRHFVMTNEHVVNEHGEGGGIMPKSALLTFTRFPNSPPVRVKQLVWSSSRHDHDTTILEINPPPEGTVTLSLANMPELTNSDDVRFVTVIGHPSGRELSLAINNLELMEHNGPGTDDEHRSVYMRYKASTEPGNSGSPVFDWDTMELMGIHHRGFGNEGHVSFQNSAGEDGEPSTGSARRRRSKKTARRSGYRTVKQSRQKRVKANQGIWLKSVIRAMQKNWPSPPNI